MSNIQEVFNRIQETKAKTREVRKMYKDALDSSHEYQEVLEKLETLKARKKQIETQFKEDSMNDFKKLDAYKMHIKTDMEMLSDLALNDLMAGKTVEVVDEHDQKYEPLFSVKFKKA
ncbi:MAG: hypothetical protein M3Q64_00465 [bacterium]|nr:hypothetical protein [bacterium]